MVGQEGRAFFDRPASGCCSGLMYLDNDKAVAHRLYTGRGLPTSSTGRRYQLEKTSKSNTSFRLKPLLELTISTVQFYRPTSFDSMDALEDQLLDGLRHLEKSHSIVRSITEWEWVLNSVANAN